MVVNKSADWGEEGEINISPDNIEVRDGYGDGGDMIDMFWGGNHQ